MVGINLTPVVGVVLALFVGVAGFYGAHVDRQLRPASLGALDIVAERPKPSIFVSLYKGRYYIDGREVTVDALPVALRRAAEGRRGTFVEVWSDQDMPYGAYFQVVRMIEEAGLQPRIFHDFVPEGSGVRSH